MHRISHTCGPTNTRSENSNLKIIFALTLVHFTGDFYSSFINPLMPVFVEHFSLTLTQVGIITGLSRFLAFVVQPPVGYLADHYRTRLFILGGPFLVIILISLVGVAPTFWALVMLVSLGSIGSSMFHPTVAGMISTYSGRNIGFSISVFNMGGTLAFGVGPLFITWFVATYGLKSTPITMVLGLMVMVYLYIVVPVPECEGLKDFGLIGSIREVFGTVWKPILLIWLIMASRAFVSQSLLTYLPVHYARQGHSLVSIGAVVSLFTIAGAFSGLIAGYLSDRIGFKPVFYGAHLLTTPAIYIMLNVPGNWLYLNTFITGVFALATLPLGVALAQKLAPKGKSMASSLMMGFALGAGGIMTPITGKLADMFSIEPVLNVIALLPVLTIALIYLMPKEIDAKS
jgi:FSR family fosmidomycin resistance protein-like MFS transporter